MIGVRQTARSVPMWSGVLGPLVAEDAHGPVGSGDPGTGPCWAGC